MAQNNNLGDFLTGVADAIRDAKGSSEQINAQDFPSEIRALGGSSISDSYFIFGKLPTNKMYLETDITTVPVSLFRCVSDAYQNMVKEIHLPSATIINGFAFANNVPLDTIYLPECTTIQGGNSFTGCTSLASIDLSKVTSISNSTFSGCSSLATVIIRTNSVCALGGSSVFSNTPIASGTGYIYVPDALVDDYKVATNWSTYASQIKGISELPS